MERCQELEGRWADLEQACEAQARHLQRAAALRRYDAEATGSGKSPELGSLFG